MVITNAYRMLGSNAIKEKKNQQKKYNNCHNKFEWSELNRNREYTAIVMVTSREEGDPVGTRQWKKSHLFQFPKEKGCTNTIDQNID